jgi:hypothetical protein
VKYVDSTEDAIIQTVRTHQHNIKSALLDSYTPQDRSTERNKTHKGEHSRENKRKMARDENTWKTSM